MHPCFLASPNMLGQSSVSMIISAFGLNEFKNPDTAKGESNGENSTLTPFRYLAAFQKDVVFEIQQLKVL